MFWCTGINLHTRRNTLYFVLDFLYNSTIFEFFCLSNWEYAGAVCHFIKRGKGTKGEAEKQPCPNTHNTHPSRNRNFDAPCQYKLCFILLERSPFWPLDSSICQIFTLTPISSKNGISTIFTIHFWPEIVILSLCMAFLAKKQEATCRKTAAKSSKNQWK